MERSNPRSFDINTFFERCMADGSRDYGSRLVSVPMHPQVSGSAKSCCMYAALS